MCVCVCVYIIVCVCVRERERQRERERETESERESEREREKEDESERDTDELVPVFDSEELKHVSPRVTNSFHWSTREPARLILPTNPKLRLYVAAFRTLPAERYTEERSRFH